MVARIALNALALTPEGTGVQTYIRELLRALSNQTQAELVAVVQDHVVEHLPVGVHPRPRPRSNGAVRALHGLRSFPGADLIHGLDVDLPLRTEAPTVATVHDLSVFDAPWAHPRARALGERILIRRALSRADAIIAVSNFTAERVEARFGRTATVTLLAPSAGLTPASAAEVARVRRRYALPDPVVVHVGTIEPRKNVPMLAEACRAAEVPLALAGAGSASGLAGPPLHLGYVPSADLPALYGAATVVAYPSRYEGFGLPPVEAAACGAAVVATAVGALPETLGEGALLVAPGDLEALTAGVKRLIHDEERRSEQRIRGRERVGALSWRETARATRAVYDSLGVPT